MKSAGYIAALFCASASTSVAEIALKSGEVSFSYLTNSTGNFDVYVWELSSDYQIGGLGFQFDINVESSENYRSSYVFTTAHLYKPIENGKIGVFGEYFFGINRPNYYGLAFGAETRLNYDRFSFGARVRGLEEYYNIPLPGDAGIEWSAAMSVGYKISPALEITGTVTRFFEQASTRSEISARYDIPNSNLGLEGGIFALGGSSGPNFRVAVSYSFGQHDQNDLF